MPLYGLDYSRVSALYDKAQECHMPLYGLDYSRVFALYEKAKECLIAQCESEYSRMSALYEKANKYYLDQKVNVVLDTVGELLRISDIISLLEQKFLDGRTYPCPGGDHDEQLFMSFITFYIYRKPFWPPNFPLTAVFNRLVADLDSIGPQRPFTFQSQLDKFFEDAARMRFYTELHEMYPAVKRLVESQPFVQLHEDYLVSLLLMVVEPRILKLEPLHAPIPETLLFRSLPQTPVHAPLPPKLCPVFRSLPQTPVHAPIPETPILHHFAIKFDSYMKPTEYLDEHQIRLLETDKRVILPTQTGIRLLISSYDVLHSWSIPSMGIKLDGCPGRLNQTFLYIKDSGLFYGQCSEICGTQHAFMPISIRAVPAHEFSFWLAQQITPVAQLSENLEVGGTSNDK